MTIETAIPFPGYYESLYSDLIDSEQEFISECENIDFDTIDDKTDYKAAFESINQVYVDALNEMLNDIDGLNISLGYKDMESPREYNYTTDRLFCEISENDLKGLFEFVMCRHEQDLRDIIQERFTSRPGFCSFYSNELDKWLFKDVTEWDHNQIETLIQAALCAEYDFEDDIYSRVSDVVSGNGLVSEHINV